MQTYQQPPVAGCAITIKVEDNVPGISKNFLVLTATAKRGFYQVDEIRDVIEKRIYNRNPHLALQAMWLQLARELYDQVKTKEQFRQKIA